MANSLNIELENRVVILEDIFPAPYNTIEERAFIVTGGFGTSPRTNGTALFGKWAAGQYKGEEERRDGYDVLRLATDEEITSFGYDPADFQGRPVTV